MLRLRAPLPLCRRVIRRRRRPPRAPGRTLGSRERPERSHPARCTRARWRCRARQRTPASAVARTPSSSSRRRARCAYVCSSSDALAGAPAELLRLPRIVEQVPVRSRRFLGVRHDEQLAAGLEPAVESLDGVRHDRRSRGGELERPASRRSVDRRMRAPRDVEVDARGGDRAREDVERDVAHERRRSDVASKVLSAEGEVDLRRETRRLADERLHPLPSELVAVAVEEDVVLLLDVVADGTARGRPPRRPPPPAARRARAAGRGRPRSSTRRGRTRMDRLRGSS